jgi:small-conductance mechanosensitive channel
MNCWCPSTADPLAHHASALLLVLERWASRPPCCGRLSPGFATVGAVAFFAAWSVLSNLFCALLIFTVRPFRIGDYIEVLDTAEKPGAKGRVVDINLLYTTLEDHGAAVGHTAWLQIPNALIFQRVVRRFQHYPPPQRLRHQRSRPRRCKPWPHPCSHGPRPCQHRTGAIEQTATKVRAARSSACK